MKRTIVFTALCVLSLGSLTAQNIHTWKMGPLSWNDFSLNTALNGKVSQLEWYMGIENASTKVGNITYSVPSAYAYTTPEYSWVDPQYKSDQLLQYNQCIFDAVELYRRKLDNQLRNQSVFDQQQILDNTMRRLNDDIQRIEQDTKNGQDTVSLRRWQNRIKDSLDRNPVLSPFSHVDAPFNWGMGFNVGFFGTGGQLHDYFSNGGGFGFDFQMGYKRALFGGDLNINFGRCRQNAPNAHDDDNDLYVNDPLSILDLYVYGGYSVINTATTRLTPFIGYGLLGFYYTPDDDGSSLGSGDGCFRLGIDYNHNFFNEVEYYGFGKEYYNGAHSISYIDVRLYASYNNFQNIVDSPKGFTINLQLGLGFRYGRTHCK